MRNAAIIHAIETLANPRLQESWDNTGLQVGSAADECTGVLVCLDVTPAVVEEAISLGCNLIVSHHPLFFKPVNQLVGATVAQASAMAAISAGITIYSSHTAADSAPGGVSYLLAEKLGVKPIKAIDPAAGRLVSLDVIVPANKALEVQAALFDAGASAVGAYNQWSFNVDGKETWHKVDLDHPADFDLTATDSVQISVVLAPEQMSRVESALLDVHPYEMPAYRFTPMLNTLSDTGIGIYGTSDADLNPLQFAEHVKQALGCQAVRTTPVADSDAKIRRVAVCGGAGGKYIARAIAMGAQAYVTADLGYHDFVEYRDQILLIDAGHFETEAPVKALFAQTIARAFPDVPVHCTNNDNPIKYL